MLALPQDVLRHIFSFCDVDSNRQFFRVCKKFYSATQNVNFLLRLLGRLKDYDGSFCFERDYGQMFDLPAVKNLIVKINEKRALAISVSKVATCKFVLNTIIKKSSYAIKYVNSFGDIDLRPLYITLRNVKLKIIDDHFLSIRVEQHTIDFFNNLKLFIQRQLQRKFSKQNIDGWGKKHIRAYFSKHMCLDKLFSSAVADVVLDVSEFQLCNGKLNFLVRVIRLTYYDFEPPACLSSGFLALI